MPGLPSVMKVKLESLRATEPAAPPIQVRPAPSAVASIAPGPRAPVETPEAPLNEDDFVVGAQPAQPGAGPSATPTAVPAEPVEPPAPREPSAEEQRVEEERKWKESAPDLYHKYKTVAGMYERSKAELAALKSDVSSLKDEIKALREAPPMAPVTPTANVSIGELTPEQQEAYKDAFPVIDTLSAKKAKEIVDQVVGPLLKEIETLKQSTNSTKAVVEDSSNQAFVNNVRSRIKDMDKIVRTPEWSDYIAKRAPYSPFTIGQLLIAAHEDRDLDRVEEIFNGFKPPVEEDINTLVTPTASGARAPVTNPSSEKKILAISHRRKASEDFRKGRLKKADFDKIDAMYRKAESEGRIDYNA